MLLNANLLFYQGLACLNQEVAYYFDYLLKPSLYPNEWKQIVALLLDFLQFKEQMLPKHIKLRQQFESSESQLAIML